MHKFFWIVVFMIYIGTGNIPQLYAGELPAWGRVCARADVRTGPYENNPVAYSVSVGTTVRLHELSHDGTWVSIDAARWMPIDNLCWTGE